MASAEGSEVVFSDEVLCGVLHSVEVEVVWYVPSARMVEGGCDGLRHDAIFIGALDGIEAGVEVVRDGARGVDTDIGGQMSVKGTG